jgi:hypothetical protein
VTIFEITLDPYIASVHARDIKNGKNLLLCFFESLKGQNLFCAGGSCDVIDEYFRK